MSNEFFKITVKIRGIKKRCRNHDLHFLKLGTIPYNNGQFDKDDIENRAISIVHENIRIPGSHPEIYLDYVLIDNDRGFQTTTYQFNHPSNVRWTLKR